jgi:hypothetical protein
MPYILWEDNRRETGGSRKSQQAAVRMFHFNFELCLSTHG